MVEKFFSVIITVYNRANLTRAALKSIALQTFKDFEVFAIDDNSTEDIKSVFDEFRDLPNWHFVHFTENHGNPYCRNYAIKNSSGKYLAFLDCDDMWLPKKLEGFYKKLCENPQAGFVFSNGYIMHENVIVAKFFDETKKIPTGRLEPYMAISNKWLPYVTPNVVFPRKVIDHLGFFREDMNQLEDMEYYVRLFKFYEVDYIPEPLSIYRVHFFRGVPASLSQRWKKGIEDFHEALRVAAPSKEIEIDLKDYVYYSQAVVYLKNSLNSDARECFSKLSKRNFKQYFLYICTFLPPFIISFVRIFFRFFRKVKRSFFPNYEFKKVQDFADFLQGK